MFSKLIKGFLVLLLAFVFTAVPALASEKSSDLYDAVDVFVEHLVSLGVSESNAHDPDMINLFEYVFSHEGAMLSVVHIGETTTELIPNSELPCGVVPMDVATQEYEGLFVDEPGGIFLVLTDVPLPVDLRGRSSSGHFHIQTVSPDPTILGLNIHLRTFFVIQGSGDNATFQSVSPYTTSTGWSLGQRWEERIVGSEILSTNRRYAYVYGAGDYVQFLLVNTSWTEIRRTAINMSSWIGIRPN